MGGGAGEVEGHIKESFVIMTCTVYCTLLTVFREFLGVINDRHLNNQCRVQSAECRDSHQYFQYVQK